MWSAASSLLSFPSDVGISPHAYCVGFVEVVGIPCSLVRLLPARHSNTNTVKVMITAAATPTPIPAAAPLDNPDGPGVALSVDITGGVEETGDVEVAEDVIGVELDVDV